MFEFFEWIKAPQLQITTSSLGKESATQFFLQILRVAPLAHGLQPVYIYFSLQELTLEPK